MHRSQTRQEKIKGREEYLAAIEFAQVALFVHVLAPGEFGEPVVEVVRNVRAGSVPGPVFVLERLDGKFDGGVAVNVAGRVEVHSAGRLAGQRRGGRRGRRTQY